MNPALKWTLLVLAGLLGLVILIVGGALVWLSSAPGRDFVLSQAENNVEGLRIEGAAGTVFDLRARRLTMEDEEGVWLVVENLRLDWSPTALLSRTLRIETASAGRVAVLRLPEGEAQEDTGPTELPVDVVLRQLALDRVELAEPVLNGETAVLRAEGAGHLPAGELGGSVRLALERIDDRPGTALVEALYMPGNRLTLEVEAREPENGVIAGLLDLPGRPPVEITLTGDGPPTDWTGTLQARAGDIATVKAEARIRPAGEVVAFGLDLVADIVELLPEDQRPLVGQEAVLAAGGFVVPGERLSLDGISLRIAAGSIAGQGVYRIDEERLNFGFHGSVGADSPIRGLLTGAEFQTVQVTGRAAGPLSAPAVNATLSILAPGYEGWGAERLTLTAVTEPGTEETGYDRFALTTTIVAEGPRAPDPEIDALLGPRAQVEATGTVVTETGDVEISRLALASRPVNATGQGRVTGWGEGVQARVNLVADRLAVFAPIAGLPDLDGQLGLDIDVRRDADGVLQAEAKGRGRNLATGIAAADALLSPETELSATAAVGADGTEIRLPAFRVAGARGTIAGQAALVAEQVEARVEGQVPDLAPLGAALGTPMAGRAVLEARIHGPLERFAATVTLRTQGLRLQNRLYDQAVLELQADALPEAPTGRLRLVSALGEQPVEATARFAMEGERLRLPELAVQAGQNRIQGALVADLTAGTAEGELAAELPDLATLGAMAGERLSGTGRADITLTAPGGRQQAVVEADLRNLSRRQPDVIQQARRLTLSARYQDGQQAPTLRATVNGQGLSSGDARIDRLAVEAQGPLTALRVGLEMQGRAGAPMALTSDATIALLDDRTRVELAALAGSYDGEAFQLARPATITLAGEGMAVEGLELSSGTARIAVDADLTGRQLSADARLERLPLALARLVDPTLELGGQVNGRATLSGTVAQPVGDLRFDIVEFRTAPDQQETPGLDATLTGTWRDGRLVAELTTRGGPDVDLRGQGSLPLVLDGGPLAFTLPEDQPVQAALRGRLDMALLNDALAGTGDRVAGRLTVDLTMAGTLADTQLAGTVAIDGGRYENQEYGTTIQEITARLDGNPDGLRIQSFTGRTPNGGTVTADGAIRFDPAFGNRQLELTLRADRARVAQTEGLRADADAELALNGSFSRALLAGRVRVRQAYVTLPDTLPQEIADLEVEEVNATDVAEEMSPTPRRRPAPPAEETAMADAGGATPAADGAPAEPDGPMVIALKVEVEAPNEIYVRGRGVDAEFKAALTIGGTTDRPEVVGDVTLIKGELSVLGQTLSLQRAVMTFTGGPDLNPQLDVEARTTRGDITAIVNLTGTPDRPQIELSSDPPAPEDEVLARLLFGRGLDQISALEAVQLAQGAAQLAGVVGTGPGIMDQVRRGLGVDRLEIRGSETGEGLGTVAAGRYLSDDLYVGLEQDLGTGQSDVTLEYDINRNIRLRGEVGRQNRVGVQFEWEY